eukprot:CAMPEP_0170850028 /NCGR_PEP_ID=MMETSP0734-20130129/10371_1 /TAXON_ID=186038 /ORGANISM="Fragilariopsis kerguelensis, Strain L26-C5" /LENGTH=150 /DNA_ID=CAMNT_0011219833 /DNA_START=417 /DNA_END=869 /DNA_ORIENTATION=+
MLLSKHGRCILLALVLGGTEVKASSRKLRRNCHGCNGSSTDPPPTGPPTNAPTNAPPIDCGGHDAPNCEACPPPDAGVEGSAWCNGNCHWCNGECQSSMCPPPISCGGHYAPNCGRCPYDASETYMGSAWCNGNCHWYNDECQSSNDDDY